MSPTFIFYYCFCTRYRCNFICTEPINNPTCRCFKQINIDGIDRITEKFLENLKDFDIIVIDELGVMELKSENFKKMLDQVLKSSQPKLIILNRHLVKFYEKYGEVIEMKRENANEIKKKLLDQLP